MKLKWIFYDWHINKNKTKDVKCKTKKLKQY